MKLTASKPWLLFAGERYYPAGGAQDFAGAYRTRRAARKALNAITPDNCGSWAQIVDVREGAVQEFRAEPTYRDHARHVWHQVDEQGEPVPEPR